jgi:threonine/homoserine/homoserine lactone efflux protein
MTIDQAFAFVLFAIVAAITPGPSNIIVAATGASVGVRRGLPCLLGVAVGMGVMLFIVALGLGSLVLENPLILGVIKWCGIVFLLWLAWKIATGGRTEATPAAHAMEFWQAAAFQWVNPKSWLVSASAAGAYLQAGAAGALVQATQLGMLFILAALPSCFLWLAFGATMQRTLRTERAWKTFNLVMGALLAGSIVLFIW